MSSHEQTIQYLMAAAQRAQGIAGIQQKVAVEIEALNGLIQQAVGNTGIAAGLDQSTASLNSASEHISQHLMSLAQRLTEVAQRLGAAG